MSDFLVLWMVISVTSIRLTAIVCQKGVPASHVHPEAPYDCAFGFFYHLGYDAEVMLFLFILK